MQHAQPLVEHEDRNHHVWPQLAFQKLVRRVTRERATLVVEPLEDQRHQIYLAQRVNHACGRFVGDTGRNCVISRRARFAAVNFAEGGELLFYAIFVNFYLFDFEVADRTPAFVACD